MNNKTLPINKSFITPAPEGLTYTVAGQEFPVIGFVNNGGHPVPLVDIPSMSDYKYQLMCLQSRLEHPEMYRNILGEDVEAEIERLKKWLMENADKYPKEQLKGA